MNITSSSYARTILICNQLVMNKTVHLRVVARDSIRVELEKKSKMDTNSYEQIRQSNNEVYIEMDLLRVGSEPVGMRCPHCHEDVMTRAAYKNTTITHIIAVILGVLFWWLCCCVVPYVVRRWKNVEHYCPNCQRFLGVYTRKTIL